MGNFNRDNKFSGGGRNFRDRGSDRTTLYDAVCAKCGKNCQVPFRPTGTKPVLCRECFRGDSGNRPEGRDQRRPRFESISQRPQNPNQVDYKKKFDELNTKLDKILKIISASNPQKDEPLPIIETTPAEKPKATAKKKKMSNKAPKSEDTSVEV